MIAPARGVSISREAEKGKQGAERRLTHGAEVVVRCSSFTSREAGGSSRTEAADKSFLCLTVHARPNYGVALLAFVETRQSNSEIGGSLVRSDNKGLVTRLVGHIAC